MAVEGDASSFDLVANDLARLESASNTAPDVRALAGRAALFLQRRSALLEFRAGSERIVANTSRLLAAVEKATVEELASGVSTARSMALNQLAMLTQRISRSAGTLITVDQPDAESVFLVGKDVKSFAALLAGLREGNPELRLRPATAPSVQRTLKALADVFAETSTQAESTLGGLRGLVEAAELHAITQRLAVRSSQALAPACFNGASMAEPLQK